MLAIGIGLLLAALSSHPQQSRDAYAYAANHYDQCDKMLLVVETQPSARDTGEESNPKSYNYYGNFNYHFPTADNPSDSFWSIREAIGAAAGALFTGVLALFAYKAARIALDTLQHIRRQTEAIEEQVKHLEGDLSETREATAAAVKSASAAVEHVAVIRENAKRELRAYVNAIDAAMSCPSVALTPLPQGSRDQLSIMFINTGNTPARKVLVHANWTSVKGYRSELPKDFAYTDVRRETSFPSVFSIAHNIPFQIDATDIINLVDVARAQRREVTVYIYGHADYVDVFDDPHVCTFCYEFMPDQPSHAFRTYKEHNDTD